MRFPFNDRRTAQAAAYLVRLAGGQLNYMKLIKLLYMADRQMLIDTGMPITGNDMVSMKHGPVLSTVLDLINEGAPPYKPSAWTQYIEAPSGYSVSLKPSAKTDPDDLDELSVRVLGILTKTFEQYGHMKEWDLVDHLHATLPEWEDPGRSVRPILPDTILRNAAKSEQHIQEIRELAEEEVLLASLGAR